MLDRYIKSLSLSGALLLGACGTYVPHTEEFWEANATDETNLPTVSAGGVLEYNIKDKVYCGIVEAVLDNKTLVPSGWAAQVTLDLQVDETGALNPGVSLITPIHSGVTNFAGEYLGASNPVSASQTFAPFVSPQSFTLGFGGTLSSQATREDKFNNYWSLDRLKKGEKCESRAKSGSSLLLESDLGISQWLHDHLVAEGLLPSSSISKNADPAFKQDSLSYHIKFVVITSGNITPTWKLVRVATNNGGLPLASVNRTRTHDLLITYGPAYKPGTLNFAASSHAAQETGIAVSNGNRTLVSP
jgi:hypothetical protein